MVTICVWFDAESPVSCSNPASDYDFAAFAFRRPAQYFRMRIDTAFRAAADIPRRRRTPPVSAGAAA